MKTKIKSTRSRLILAAAIAAAPFLAAGSAAAQASPTSVNALRNYNPYYYVGRLTYKDGTIPRQGSGTVIKPYSILTAAHCLWSRGNGWRTNFVFQRAYSNGTWASSSTARQPFILGGYTTAVINSGANNTAAAFSRDTGGIIFFSRPMNGGYAGWWQNPALLTGPSYNMCLGYGSEWHNGQEMLRSAPSSAFIGQTASWYTNTSCAIEAGMSGGPVFAQYNNLWYVCAVNVSGTASRTSGGGVRAIDADTSVLIKNYLQ
ncbi:MAG: hypothetical protein JWM59_3361 [Verrucomicrobiales bacterium]|nr:hypothetical protein [Verrucomicrobiales bacterium]